MKHPPPSSTFESHMTGARYDAASTRVTVYWRGVRCECLHALLPGGYLKAFPVALLKHLTPAARELLAFEEAP